MNAPTRDLKAKLWARDPLDYYVEPPEVSAALFRVERFVGHIWDPACGRGNILKAAIESGYRNCVVGSDVERRSCPFYFHGMRDFLDEQKLCLAQNIVTNPPYFSGKGTERFIRKALELAIGKVAIFTDTRFLSGDARARDLFKLHRPHRIWLLTPRPSCPPGAWLDAGNKAGGGTADYCWLVWSLTEPPPSRSEIDWLRWTRAKA